MRTPPAPLAAQLLEQAESVLTDPAVRLEDVARRLGTSRARLYYYFAGLEDLRSFLVARHLQDGASVLATAADPALDPPERLRAAVTAAVRYLAGRPGVCAGVLAGAGGSPDGVLADTDAVVGARVRALLTEGVGDGSFRPLDVAAAADALLGAILLAVLGRARRGTPADVEAFAAALADQLVTGLLPRP